MYFYFKALFTDRGIFLLASTAFFSISLVTSFFVKGYCSCDDVADKPEGDCSLRVNLCQCATENKVTRSYCTDPKLHTHTSQRGNCNYSAPIIVLCTGSIVLLIGAATFFLNNDLLSQSTKS